MSACHFDAHFSVILPLFLPPSPSFTLCVTLYSPTRRIHHWLRRQSNCAAFCLSLIFSLTSHITHVLIFTRRPRCLSLSLSSLSSLPPLSPLPSAAIISRLIHCRHNSLLSLFLHLCHLQSAIPSRCSTSGDVSHTAHSTYLISDGDGDIGSGDEAARGIRRDDVLGHDGAAINDPT